MRRTLLAVAAVLLATTCADARSYQSRHGFTADNGWQFGEWNQYRNNGFYSPDQPPPRRLYRKKKRSAVQTKTKKRPAIVKRAVAKKSKVSVRAPVARPKINKPLKITPMVMPSGVEVDDARDYLVRTSGYGGTMAKMGRRVMEQATWPGWFGAVQRVVIERLVKQGTKLEGKREAIDHLHPVFAVRLAAAVYEARQRGLEGVGVFSGFRDPKDRVGGFEDKSCSFHAVGLAVDMQGIGRPGSAESRLWSQIAAKHGIYGPYGANHRKEWNHYQPGWVRGGCPAAPLRGYAKAGDTEHLWLASAPMIAKTGMTPRLYASYKPAKRRVRLASR